MNTNFCRTLFVSWFGFCFAMLVMAAPSGAAAPEDDFNLNEFPARPAPTWVKMIDQGSKNPKLKGIHTPAGIKVEIVAEDPVVVDPVGMTFSDEGVPHVLEWRVAKQSKHMQYEVTFQDGTKATVNRMWKDTRDELKTLADADGDGVFDQSTVIMNDLEIPSSVLLYDGWIYLSSIGHVVRRRQSQPGGPYDVEEEIVKGLCGFHHHQASGMTISHDGWLFITAGDDDNNGEGSDGSRATVLRTGAVFRCRPDGSELHEFARGFRNPYRDVAFDHYYNMFHVDNDQEDGSKFQGVRLMHILEGSDFGWRLLEGAVCCRTDFVRGAVFGERPGKVPSMLKTGRGSPAGLLIYQGTRFPEFFRGLLIYPDVYRKMVRAYAIERAGSSFKVVQQFELMKSDDGLFRPCQALQGPDGAIYIVDWRTDSGGAGRLWGDGKNGRIYRLSWEGIQGHPALPLEPMNTWAQIKEQSDDALFKQLDTEDFEIRKRTQWELLRRAKDNPDKYRGRFVEIALDKQRPVPARIVAMGAACQLWNKRVEEVLGSILADDHFEVRRNAADLLARQVTSTGKVRSLPKSLVEQADHPAVQRSFLLAKATLLAHVRADELEQAATALVKQIAADSSDDIYVRDAKVRALERFGKPALQYAAGGVINATNGELREQLVSLFEATRSREAAQALDTILAADTSKLSRDQLIRLISTYRHVLVKPPIEATAVATWLEKHQEADAAVQLAALETLGLVGGAKDEQLQQLAVKLLGHEDETARLRVIRTIGDARLNNAAKALAEALQDHNRSVNERREIIASLSKLRSRRLPFNNQMTPPGVELVFDELTKVAQSPAAGEIRGDALSLMAQVNFGKAEPIAIGMLRSGDVQAAGAAIDVLGARPNRAKQLGRQFVAGKLDRSLLPQIAAALRKHVEKDKTGQFAKLLNDVFRGGLLLSLEPEEVKRVERLVAEKGNPERGRAVYLNADKSQCAKCHQLEGVGGQIGPDLSKIWQTHNVAKIMESMIDPSKEIKEGFATWTVVTSGGQVYNGLKILDDGKEVVLRDASGKDIRIAAADVDEKIASKKSLMPEGVVAQLAYDEFVDLVAFLKSQQAQQVLRNQLGQVWVVGPFGPGVNDTAPPEKSPSPERPVSWEGKTLPWRSLSARTDGWFNLKGTFAANNASVYALTYVRSPKEQQVDFKVGYDDAIKVLVNGEKVDRSGRVQDDELIRARLQPGWNTLLLRVANGQGEFGFRLSVAKGEGLRFSLEPKDEVEKLK